MFDRHQCYVAITCLMLNVLIACSAHAQDASTIEGRLSRTVGLLASDEMAGRGLESQELEAAAEYIRLQFEELGLQTDAVGGSAFQPFSYSVSTKLGDANRASFAVDDDARIEMTMGQEYRPLALGGVGEFDLPVVFAGYGITAPDANYDDYAGVDVQGKAVIILRHEPQQADANSAFNGIEHSEHAPFRRKVSNAIEHGAAAIIFCTDQFEVDRLNAQSRKRAEASQAELEKLEREFDESTNPQSEKFRKHQQRVKRLQGIVAATTKIENNEQAKLLPFNGAGQHSDAARPPILFCNRVVLDDLFMKTGLKDLATLEAQIDQQFKPKSFELPGWRLAGQVDIQSETIDIKNVIGVLPGVGSLADETVVVGAHYDHIGFGNRGPADGKGQIHNGADDNASGVAALLEVVRHLTEPQADSRRRLVFIAFTGEERGLLGSAHYVNDPLFPLEQTAAMINFDMVGRLKDNRLIASGSDTATEFEEWLDEINQRHGFDLRKTPGGFGPSDHSSFYGKQIPVLHIFTGLHQEYHRPGDDIELLNMQGLGRISTFASEIIDRVATNPQRPTYFDSSERTPIARQDSERAYLGVALQSGKTSGGFAISRVFPGSPAADAGFQAGDIIVGVDENEMEGVSALVDAIGKRKPGDKVRIRAKRGDEELDFETTLGKIE